MKSLTRKAIIMTGVMVMTTSLSHASPDADTDKNGEISRAEFIAAADAKFTKSDVNGDGIVTKTEREDSRASRKAETRRKIFDKIDTNADGFISVEEFENASEKRAERRKKRWDVNGDGNVDRLDRKEQLEKRRDARKQMKEHRKNMRDRGEPRVRMDANEDGVVTREEHDAATNAMFDRLDVNGDGVLTEGEGRRRGKRGMRRRR